MERSPSFSALRIRSDAAVVSRSSSGSIRKEAEANMSMEVPMQSNAGGIVDVTARFSLLAKGKKITATFDLVADDISEYPGSAAFEPPESEPAHEFDDDG